MMNWYNDDQYVIIMWFLGVVVRVSYMVFNAEKLEWIKIFARLVISIIAWWIVGDNISKDISRNWVEAYWPIIRLVSFFSVDIIQWLASYKVKDKVQSIAKKVVDKIK